LRRHYIEYGKTKRRHVAGYLGSRENVSVQPTCDLIIEDDTSKQRECSRRIVKDTVGVVEPYISDRDGDPWKLMNMRDVHYIGAMVDTWRTV
jgi:hypothetical protein